ncbi:ABC transporter permease [Limnochorda pilosa]|uniref:Transport permease protein n=1 Tax=Limnochorda pilosa TaxID=1555112 RepID=A0A0K2SJB9_LIMPI|nr:ABC transporter permease [Limnochorda pilosa]BAS27175.1 ABC transporter [Limnochorda pilosa]
MSVLEQRPVVSVHSRPAAWASDVYVVFWREMKHFAGQRLRILMMLVQPVIWLVLMGNVMNGFTRIPAAQELIGAGSYVAFMVPGIVVMTALFAGLFSGMSVVWDRRFGFLQKMLASPIRRSAIALGKMAAAAVQGGIQAAVILGLGLLMGVRPATGLPGAVTALALAMLFALSMAGLSLAVAAAMRSQEALMAIMNFLTMPLLFTSDAIFPRAAMPGWLAGIARVNPVSFTVRPVRELVLSGWDWGAIAAGAGAVLLFSLVMTALATRQLERGAA